MTAGPCVSLANIELISHDGGPRRAPPGRPAPAATSLSPRDHPPLGGPRRSPIRYGDPRRDVRYLPESGALVVCAVEASMKAAYAPGSGPRLPDLTRSHYRLRRPPASLAASVARTLTLGPSFTDDYRRYGPLQKRRHRSDQPLLSGTAGHRGDRTSAQRVAAVCRS
jgi:hypothetical protein